MNLHLYVNHPLTYHSFYGDNTVRKPFFLVKRKRTPFLTDILETCQLISFFSLMYTIHSNCCKILYLDMNLWLLSYIIWIRIVPVYRQVCTCFGISFDATIPLIVDERKAQNLCSFSHVSMDLRQNISTSSFTSSVTAYCVDSDLVKEKCMWTRPVSRRWSLRGKWVR